eukprot:1291504-Pyramimonas_sp.AAC.1
MKEKEEDEGIHGVGYDVALGGYDAACAETDASPGHCCAAAEGGSMLRGRQQKIEGVPVARHRSD